MSKPMLLDAYSCAGVGADGYKAAGFEVVCLDNDPKALRHNPHPTILGDALTLLSDQGFVREFAVVHHSSPCQLFTAARCLADAQGKSRRRAVDLLHPTRELLDRAGVPWVAENVTRSPVRTWPGAVRVCGSSFGLLVERHRWFAPSPGLTLTGTTCNHSTFEVDDGSRCLHAPDHTPKCNHTGKPRPWGVYYAKGDNIPSGGRTVASDEHGHEVMGVTNRWVPWPYLREALPPAYTELLGRQLLAQL